MEYWNILPRRLSRRVVKLFASVRIVESAYEIPMCPENMLFFRLVQLKSDYTENVQHFSNNILLKYAIYKQGFCIPESFLDRFEIRKTAKIFNRIVIKERKFLNGIYIILVISLL